MFAPLLKNAAAAAPLTLALVLGASAPTTTTGQTVAPGVSPRARGAVTTPLDLNTATAEELAATLPGVGVVNTRKIVAGRPYRSVDDLSRAGIPAREIEAIRKHVTVSRMAEPKAKAGTRRGTTATAAARVDLNTASVGELEALPGIGPAHARAIIAARPIRSLDDLENVRGLGRSRIDALRDRALVSAPTAATTPPPVRPEPAPRRAMPRPAPGTAPGATGAAAKAVRSPRLAPGQVVNLNTATRAELDALPGIGPVKAQAILDARPFKTKEDVMRVKGIKQGEFAKIRDLIAVD